MAQNAILDTNILIYAYDTASPDKQRRAIETLRQLEASSAGYLSVKTLSEFFVVATRRLAMPLTIEQAIAEMLKFTAGWPVLDLTAAIAIEAARGVRDHGLSYWDAQMWATAKAHGLRAVFSEIMATGSVLDGVAIRNPLDPAFDLPAWLAG